MAYCSKCGKEVAEDAAFCPSCGNQLKVEVVNNNSTTVSNFDSNKVVRFILTFFLGFIGSIIINHTSLRPRGWKSRTLAYFFLSLITFGIYGLVACICNFVFDPNANKNIGYFKVND